MLSARMEVIVIVTHHVFYNLHPSSSNHHCRQITPQAYVFVLYSQSHSASGPLSKVGNRMGTLHSV